MTNKRKDCPMRHENGNCTVAGGFCTAVNDPVCEALHNAFNCGYRSAIRQQEHFRDLTKKVEPLTLDELRRMEGQPVYIVENTEYWAIVNSFDQAGVYLLSYGNPDDYGYFGFYGKTWLAYRQKPEEADYVV